MAPSAVEVQRQKVWATLFGALETLLAQHGRADPFGNGDFCLVDDDYGEQQQKVEFTSATVDKLGVMQATQRLLARDFPLWEVVFVTSASSAAPDPHVVGARSIRAVRPESDDA